MRYTTGCRRMRATCLLVLFVIPYIAFAQQVWDLKNDFSTTNNPSGAWEYGDYDNGGSGFVRSNQPVCNSDGCSEAEGWQHMIGSSDPSVLVYYQSIYGIHAGSISLQCDTG